MTLQVLWGDEKMAEVVAKAEAQVVIMFNPVMARPQHLVHLSSLILALVSLLHRKTLDEFEKLPVEETDAAFFDPCSSKSGKSRNFERKHHARSWDWLWLDQKGKSHTST